MRQILEHNYNNFRCSMSVGFELYSSGKFSRRKMTVFFVRSVLERMKLRHWRPQHFIDYENT